MILEMGQIYIPQQANIWSHFFADFDYFFKNSATNFFPQFSERVFFSEMFMAPRLSKGRCLSRKKTMRKEGYIYLFPSFYYSQI